MLIKCFETSCTKMFEFQQQNTISKMITFEKSVYKTFLILQILETIVPFKNNLQSDD